MTTSFLDRLRLIAPVIRDHGLDYERGKLQDKINNGSLTLERTEVSLHCHPLIQSLPTIDQLCPFLP